MKPNCEATIFCQYLSHKKAHDGLIHRYNCAISVVSQTTPSQELKLLEKILKYSFLLPFLDAGFALLKPQHILRKRLKIMVALLETSPEHIYLFLNKKDSSFLFWKICLIGFKAIFNTIVGIILIYIFRWR